MDVAPTTLHPQAQERLQEPEQELREAPLLGEQGEGASSIPRIVQGSVTVYRVGKIKDQIQFGRVFKMHL